MSRIEFEEINENEVEVTIPSHTPMEMVTQLTKALTARGLVEDLAKSTLSVRYFKRPIDKANTVADELIKSLQRLTKGDELPYWHPKAQMANQKRVREMEIAERRAKLGIKTPTNVSPSPEPHVMPATPAIKPPANPAAPVVAPPKGPSTLPGVPNKNYNPDMSGTVNYAKKSDHDDEHVAGCRCEDCLEMKKSGYGPKKGGQYVSVDNARRKANNTGDQTGLGPNVNTKAYSTKPGQLSGKASADLTARIQNKANKKQPVKQWTPEEIAAEEVKRGLKKGSWGQHLPFPSAEEEIMKFAGHPVPQGDEALSNQLAQMMRSKAMFSNHQQPSKAEFDAAGEAMGLAVTEEMVKAADHKWNNTMNWLQEATKPISSRFASEAEEIAYWNSIKVAGSGRDDDTGY